MTHGIYVYTYDAWNRLAKVEKAFIDGSNLTKGSVVAEFEYDGLGRRIVKRIRNSAGLNAEHHFYYDGQRVIEVRNAEDEVLKQMVWAPTPGSVAGVRSIATTHGKACAGI